MRQKAVDYYSFASGSSKETESSIKSIFKKIIHHILSQALCKRSEQISTIPTLLELQNQNKHYEAMGGGVREDGMRRIP